MTPEQLQTVRAERWRQASNPVLTLDDAAAWLDSVGLCLFLPRRQQLHAPAPSFVEACIGSPSDTPAREAIENAGSLMVRLTEAGTVLPLNLFGTLSEQPDFLATREAFPYLFSLRGDRNWKTVPAGKTSPLVVEIWKALDKERSLTASEIQSALGRELTEAAVLRGLVELWSGLRVTPVYDGSGPARWELLQTRFADALTAANKLSQTTALSALVSLYLDAAIAATGEEVETFLSTVTSRSRVREVVHGLTATRQLSTIPMGVQTMVHITGSLPEFAEAEAESAPPAEAPRERGAFGRPQSSERTPREFESENRGVQRYDSEGRREIAQEPPRPLREDRERPRERSQDRPGRRDFAARPPRERNRPFRKSAADGESKPWTRKPEGERSERKPFGKRPFDKSAKPFRRDARPYGQRGPEGERPPSSEGQRPRSFEGRPRSTESRSGDRPGPRKPGFREGGKFPPKRFGGSGDRPWKDRSPDRGSDHGQDRGSDRPAGEGRRAAGGDQRPGKFGGKLGGKGKFSGSKFTGSKSGPSKFGTSRSGGGKPSGSFGKRSGGFAGKSFSGKSSRSAGTGQASEGGKRPFFRKRSEESSGARPFRPKFGDRPSGESRPPRRDGESRPPRREGGWKAKPAGSQGRFSKPDSLRTGESGSDKSAKPFNRSTKPAFGKSGKPAFGKSAKPGFGKSKFGKAKPGGSGKFGGKRFGSGKPGTQKPGRPGGSRPPFKKRKDSGKESSE